LISNAAFWSRFQFGFTIIHHLLVSAAHHGTGLFDCVLEMARFGAGTRSTTRPPGFGLYSTLDPNNSLTANAVAASQSSLHLAAIW